MERPKAPTLADVARRAGVSNATVSRVINGVDVVSEATRSRVQKAIEALGYRPDERARSLARGDSHTLGLIVSNLENDFYLDIFQALETEAGRWDYDVVVANTDYKTDRLISSIRAMVAQRVAGLAIVVTEIEPAVVRELAEESLPVVVYDCAVPAANFATISIDDYASTRRVVDYLYGAGHRRFAFVGHHTAHEPLRARERAFRDVLSVRSDAVFQILSDADSPEGGLRAARILVGSDLVPTAVVCLNDFMAIGVIKGLREAGLRVPEDVSVTGFDDISLAKFTSPALTTMAVPREWIGRLAASALIPRAGGIALGQDIVVDLELLVRDSTAPHRAPLETELAPSPASSRG